jgi:hypothetical protein
MSLASCEQVIENGLAEFVKVGQALLTIKDEKLYSEQYGSFEEYCNKRWSLSLSMGYHLIAANSVVKDLDAEKLPTLPSHAAALSILKSPESRNKAWREALELDELRAEDIRTIAQKHYVLDNDNDLAVKVRHQEMTPRKAYSLRKELERLPDYYGEAVRKFGLKGEGVDSDALHEIRQLEYQFQDEATDILRSGYLNDIPLYNMKKRDVEAHKRRLLWEKSQIGKIETTTLTVLAGRDIVRGVEAVKSDSVVFLFPEKEIATTDLLATLESKDLSVFFLVAYKGNAKINFDGTPKHPTSVNGVKPKWVNDAIRQAVLTIRE